jgi:hypothetical protein
MSDNARVLRIVCIEYRENRVRQIMNRQLNANYIGGGKSSIANDPRLYRRHRGIFAENARRSTIVIGYK